MVLTKDMAIYQINMTQVPEKERRDLEERIEKEIGGKLLELKNNATLNLKEINCFTSSYSGSKYRWNDKISLVLQMYIKADCDNYEVLSAKLNEIFSNISIFNDGLYQSHSIERCKDFGIKSLRSRPVWL